MITSENEQLEEFLFRNDTDLLNIKFFRGDRDIVSAAELRQECHSAFMQKRMGRAVVSDKFPDIDAEAIDVKEFVQAI